MQGADRSRSQHERGAVSDRAFGSELARRRERFLRDDRRSRDPLRRCGLCGGETRGEVEFRCRNEFTRAFEIEIDERTDIVAVGTGDDDVVRERCNRGDRPRAQSRSCDPRARREFEVLAEPTRKREARIRVCGVDEFPGVARAIESEFVEGGRRRIGRVSVAGRHARSANA